MNFDYSKNPTTVTIFGKEYEIPTKTAFFAAETTRINAEIAHEKDEIKIASLTLEGIRLYLGDDFVAERYTIPVDEIDTDEIGALWLFLMRASAKATAEVLKEYASD